MRLTDYAHLKWQPFLFPGANVLDATLGNGFDAAFLANSIAPSGQLFGFDLQSEAVTLSRQKLLLTGLPENHFHLFQSSHALLRNFIPHYYHAQLNLAVYNLGYLPNGKHEVTTTAKTTRMALEQTLPFVRIGGALSIMAYRGHPGAMDEFATIEQFLSDNHSSLSLIEKVETGSATRPGPVLFLLQKQA